MFADIFFILFFFLFLLVGLFVILTNNPVHSILALVLVFFLSSSLAVALGVEFLAILILIVYVGAISVLFLFVVMLLNIRVLELNVSLLKYWWLGVMYSAFFLLNLAYASAPLYPTHAINAPLYLSLEKQTLDWTSISQFGELIFLYFPHLLILAALVLFVAIVSPVLLTFVSFASVTNPASRSVKPRRQNIFQQTLRLSVDKNFAPLD